MQRRIYDMVCVDEDEYPLRPTEKQAHRLQGLPGNTSANTPSEHRPQIIVRPGACQRYRHNSP
ncbi:MAG: hypothetical protein ACOX55_10100 [Christensenellales bacterium]